MSLDIGTMYSESEECSVSTLLYQVEVLTFVYTGIISSSLFSLSVSSVSIRQLCCFVEDMDIKSFLDDINQVILIRASFILFFV